MNNKQLLDSPSKSWFAIAQEVQRTLVNADACAGTIATRALIQSAANRHQLSANSLQRTISAAEFLKKRFPAQFSETTQLEIPLSKVELLKRIDGCAPDQTDRLFHLILCGSITLRELRELHAKNIDCVPVDLKSQRSDTKIQAARFDVRVFHLLSNLPSLTGSSRVERPQMGVPKPRYLRTDAIGTLADGRRLGMMFQYMAIDAGWRVMQEGKLPLSAYFSSSFFDSFLVVLPHHVDTEQASDLLKWLRDNCKVPVSVALFRDDISGQNSNPISDLQFL